MVYNKLRSGRRRRASADPAPAEVAA
jgi:hypothetical protein